MFTNITKKIFILVVVGTLLGTSISSLLTYRVLDTRLRQSLKNNTGLKAEELESNIDKTKQLVELTVVDIKTLKAQGIKDFTVYDRIVLNRFDYILKYLDTVVSFGYAQIPNETIENRTAHSTYFIVSDDNTDRNLTIGVKLPPPYEHVYQIDLNKENYLNSPLFVIPTQTKKPYFSPTFYWSDLQANMYISPIIDNQNNVLGIVGATISTEALKKVLETTVSKTPNAGFFTLIDKKGSIIFHPRFKETISIQANYTKIEELSKIGKEILSSKEPVGEYHINGNYIIYNKLVNADWILIAIVPTGVVTLPILITSLANLIVSLCIISVVFYFFSAELNERLTKLSNKCLDILKRNRYRDLKSSVKSLEELDNLEEEIEILHNSSLRDFYIKYAIDNNLNSNDKDELVYLDFAVNIMSYKLYESIEELEITVAERTMKLETERDRADIASRAKSEFLANVSHELRTPLNSIIGNTEILLRSRKIIESEKPKLQIINTCSHYLLGLINDLLDITKIETRKLELVKKLFSTSYLIESLKDICYSSCSHKGIDFIYVEEGNLPGSILSDEKRLRQVLLNLLSNAIKFTKKGSVKFTVKGEKIPKKLNTYKMTFSIEDTGVGIPEDQLKSIFKPFEQSTYTKSKFEGTGLGLSICTKILKELNTELKVTSTLNKGSTFWFDVEFEGVKDSLTYIDVESSKLVVGFEGADKSILVVDDRWENRNLLCSLLEPLNFEIIESNNGLDAIEKLSQLSKLPDLIISDISMPELDGYGFLLKIKKEDRYKSIPIIMSSASVFEADRLNSLKAGADAFIPKPIDYSALLNSIQELLNINWKYEDN